MSETIRSKSKKEIAAEYQMNYRAFLRLLQRKEIELPKGYLCVKEIYRLYQILGFPSVQHRREWEATCSGLTNME